MLDIKTSDPPGLTGMMEFPFDINQLFPGRVSILDHTLDAARKFAGR